MLRFASALAVVFPVLVFGNSTGAPPESSWVDTNQTCARSGCHTGTHNIGAGVVTISFPGNLTYAPGVKQRLTITVTDLSQPLNFGFQVTARISSNPALMQAGTWTPLDNSTQVICEDASVRNGAACPVNAPVEFIGHKTPSTTGVWQVDWTPPASAVGDIQFFVAALAGNANGVATGDRTFLSDYRLTPVSPVSITSPQVQPGAMMLSNYSVNLNATGGAGGAYVWSASNVPPGLTMTSNGTLSGTPLFAGTYTFTATVYESGTLQNSASQQFTVTIAPAPNYTTFTIPNTASVTVAGINGQGDVVGTANYNDAFTSRGFIRLANGSIQLFEVPGATNTFANAINGNGDVVGTFGGGGYLRDANGNFTSIDRPGQQSTKPTGINNQRQIVGTSFLQKTNAFLYTPGGAFVDFRQATTSLRSPSTTWVRFSVRVPIPRRFSGRWASTSSANPMAQRRSSVPLPTIASPAAASVIPE